MINKITIEVCCGGLDDCLVANEFDIDRIELNTALELGGLTASLSTLKLAKKLIDVPICCMVRPRGDGFCYSDNEFLIMQEEAKALLENGADGIVFGFLNPNATIDIEKTAQMVKLIKSYHKEAVFHKAFDNTDMSKSIETLINLKIDRILTSGGNNYPNLLSGGELLKTLQAKYGDQIQLLVGGGVRSNNVKEIIQITNISQVHMTASTTVIDPSTKGNGYTKVNQDKLAGILSEITKL